MNTYDYDVADRRGLVVYPEVPSSTL